MMFDKLSNYAYYNVPLARTLGVLESIVFTDVRELDDINIVVTENYISSLSSKSGITTDKISEIIERLFANNILIKGQDSITINYNHNVFNCLQLHHTPQNDVVSPLNDVIECVKPRKQSKLDKFKTILSKDILLSELNDFVPVNDIAIKYGIEPSYYVNSLIKEYGIEKPNKKAVELSKAKEILTEDILREDVIKNRLTIGNISIKYGVKYEYVNSLIKEYGIEKPKAQYDKKEVYRERAISRIKTDNEELRTAYTQWIDNVIERFGFFNNMLIDNAQKLIDDYTDKDLDKALDIINIAAMNSWKDMQYAINRYQNSNQFSCNSTQNILQYKPMNETQLSELQSKLDAGSLKKY